MSQTIDIDELLIALSGTKLSGWVGVPDLLRPAAKEDRYASVLRAVCCAWCRVFQDRHVDCPDSLKALSLIEEFCRGNAPGDSLSIARRLAKKSARQLARRAGKTKEYWACHAICEAARNNAYESLLWTSNALKNAGLYRDEKLAMFRQVVQGMTAS